ncbi:hypothetical protein [Pseudotabrizicola sp. 4114]|uniref:hypothetical protein n=1 Tax=Pseudotabrizicola sp. 4114 TaxID=2817731 RepID=UPI002858E048|nr:hypothetical protein [Pseudorhodobacter sp. 4114]
MGFLALLTDVLFVGHSLIGPDLPPLVEGGLRLMERPASVSAQIINGAPLRFNLENSATAEGVDARAELAKGQTEVLILTEAIPLAEHLRWNDTPGAIAAFAELARAGNPDVRVFVYETWHSRTGAVVEGDPNSALPWRERLTADLPLWEGALRDSGADVALIPAGQAMARLADAVAAGTVPGVASMDAFFSDDIHPSDKGRYFVALVHMAAITGTSPEGLPAQMTRTWQSREAVIAADLAAVLQRLAWEAVSGYSPAAATAAAGPAQGPVQAAVDAPEAEAVDPVPAPAPPMAQAVIDPAVLTPITNPNLALGLHGITDWSVQQPFLDVMKTAREWTGHLPGQYGGWDHDRLAAAGALGPNGWPIAIPPEITGISTLVLVDLPADAGGVAGRYLVTYAGKGGLRIEGRAQNVVIGDGMAQFDFTPGEGGVVLTLDAIDAVDPIREIVIVREDRAALLAQGQIFNPDWLSRLRGVKTIRLMDWMRTNDSKLAHLEDRPKPEDYTWTRIGAPVEVMVALANELDANPWFTMPHLASDALVRFYAETARDGLEPGLVAHVEFSNEVWNWQFDQAAWAEEQGRIRWGGDSKWVQYYALRAGEVATLWADVYGDEASTRLVRILATQTGWLGLEDQILTAPDVIAEGGVAPATLFDAYAITGYFSALLGSDEKAAMVRDWIAESEAAARTVAQAQGLQAAEAEAFVAAHRFDLAVARAVPELESGAVTGKPEDSVADYLTRTLPHQAQAAAAHGLRLMMYEGGSHVVGHGAQVDDDLLTAFFVHLSYTPEMAQLYDRMLQGWTAVTPEPFNAFVDLASPGKWGSWGALRHLGDDNPRWQVLAKGCNGC